MAAAALVEIEVCPPAAALAAFVAGDASAAGVEEHIDVCGACRAALSFAVKGRAGEARMGRYQLGTVVGAGGMGVVYRAWDPQLGREVALKVVAGGERRDGLLREARSLARVAHANVCGVFDAGVEGEDVWIAMELVDGVTLREWCAVDGRSRAEIVGVLAAAGRGLEAAHEAGVVHRDVKPENVLVARDGRAVVTDFGLARVEVGVATTIEMDGGEREGVVIAGTPAYMAPEQITGEDVDARADQFAWAVMAWELLVGARPFPVEAAARLAAVRAGVGVKAGDRVGMVLARGMREVKKERWEGMAEIVGRLESAVGRRRVGAALVGAVAIGAVGALVIAMTMGGGESSPSPSPTTAASTTTSTAMAAATPAMPRPVPVPVQVQVQMQVPVQKPLLVPAAKKTKARPVDVLFGPVDAGRAEATIADECGVPMDPAYPEEGLRKPVVDWGRVVRWEDVEVGVAGRQMRMLLYEVKGARRTYVFDGAAWGQTLGVLDAAVGEEVVICPGDDVDLFVLPAGWSGQLNAANAFMRVARAPRISAREVRDGAKAHGRVLVRAAPRTKIDGGWDMGGWRLEVGAVPGADLLKEEREVWIVMDADGGAGKAVEVRASILLSGA